MSYIKRYLENLVHAIKENNAQAGDELDVETETPKGKTVIHHKVSPSDMDWYRDYFELPPISDEESEKEYARYEGASGE